MYIHIHMYIYTYIHIHVQVADGDGRGALGLPRCSPSRLRYDDNNTLYIHMYVLLFLSIYLSIYLSLSGRTRPPAMFPVEASRDYCIQPCYCYYC